MSQQGSIRSISPSWQNQAVFNPPYQNNKFNLGYSYSQNDFVIQNVKKLTGNSVDRAEALFVLSFQRETIPDLAIYLMESPTTLTSLLMEIISVCPQLTAIASGQAPTQSPLNSKTAGRVCHALALLQCIAGNKETQIPFIRANIPIYLFPFLHATNASRECECFKLTSLGVIGSLVKNDSPEIIEYLNQNEFVPLCLRILKFGQEMSKIVAAYILQKILADQNSRGFVASSSEKIETILKVLNIVVIELANNFNPRLSRNIVIAYQNILKIPDSKNVLPKVQNIEKLSAIKLPENFDPTFSAFLSQLQGLIHH